VSDTQGRPPVKLLDIATFFFFFHRPTVQKSHLDGGIEVEFGRKMLHRDSLPVYRNDLPSTAAE